MKKFIAFIIITIFLSGCSYIDNITQQKENNFEEYTLGEDEVNTNDNTEKISNEIKSEYISKLIADMTIEEKVGQMFMLAWRKDDKGNNITSINDDIISDINYIKPGGVILFGENIDTEEQTKEFIESLQEQSKISLFMGIDEEGGRVSRLHYSGNIDTPQIPSAQQMEQSGNPIEAENNMAIIAKEISKLGFNVDFAPVADINTNPENTVIGDRAFGSTPEVVSEFVVSAINGLQKNNISSCVKHFPGHGDTYTDTHTTETFVEHDITRLENCELIPFEEAIQNNVDFIMASHIKVPNVDKSNLPTSLSKTMISQLLREYMGFDKIVITDALDMGAITDYYTDEEIAQYGIDADIDIFLMPKNPNILYDYILNGVKKGIISEERINKSVERILEVKYNRGLLDLKNE